MGAIITTGGDREYPIPYCDCGLTGGCKECQPAWNPKYARSGFLDDNLREFYRKRGLLYKGEEGK